MTGRATSQLGCRPNLVVRRQLFADFRLIRRGLPIHVENLIVRPEHVFGIAMTVQAPRHLQCRSLKHQRHLVDLPVTAGTSNAFGHVNTVIKINKIGQPVHANPLNRVVGAITFADWLQIARGVKQHRMAVHAGFCGGNASGRGTLDAGMTVPAVDTVVPDVMLVAELNRLITGYVLVRQIRRARCQQNARQRQTRQEKRREDTEAGDEIRAAVKNLRHDYVCTLEVSAPGGSGNLGVHQNLSGMCQPESKLTR